MRPHDTSANLNSASLEALPVCRDLVVLVEVLFRAEDVGVTEVHHRIELVQVVLKKTESRVAGCSFAMSVYCSAPEGSTTHQPHNLDWRAREKYSFAARQCPQRLLNIPGTVVLLLQGAARQATWRWCTIPCIVTCAVFVSLFLRRCASSQMSSPHWLPILKSAL